VSAADGDGNVNAPAIVCAGKTTGELRRYARSTGLFRGGNQKAGPFRAEAAEAVAKAPPPPESSVADSNSTVIWRIPG
jgi:hypothetical protein